MDSIAVLVFTFECCVKILEQGDQPLVYFTDPDQGWLNCFDFALVAVSAVEFIASAGRGEIMHDYAVFRIVRLLRLLSLLCLCHKHSCHYFYLCPRLCCKGIRLPNVLFRRRKSKESCHNWLA